MIDRYSHPQVTQIYNQSASIRRWTQIEIAVLQAQAKAGLVDADAATRAIAAVRDLGPAYVEWKAERLEKELRHDVAAFVQVLGEVPDGHLFHADLTSSDLVDTGDAMAMAECRSLLLDISYDLVNYLGEEIERHSSTKMAGRTHGQLADTMTLSHRIVIWEGAVRRAAERLISFSPMVMISGPVGDHRRAGVGWPIQNEVARDLGLASCSDTSQVVPRDIYLDWAYAMLTMLLALEKMAVDLRIMSRSEVGELTRVRADGAIGSSSMPHKANPVQYEKVCGLARVGRGYFQSVAESVALWEERDISHSSVERLVLPGMAHIVAHCTDLMVGGLHFDVAALGRWAAATPDTYDRLNDAVMRGESRTTAHKELS